ncbi:MAG: hypothetical protein V3S69_01600, partial [Dehalococcoidales bacterium]
MSTTLHLTGDSISETWSATNKSDSWAGTAPDGGSVTKKLGTPSVPPGTAETVIFSSLGDAVNIHMGTWVTDVGTSAPLLIPLGASFAVNELHGYETAGQLNAYVWFKLSVVTESGGVLSFDRTIIPWTECTNEGTPQELGTTVGSAAPMGGYSSNAIVNYVQTTALETLAIGERLAIEIGIVTAGRNGEQIAIEYGAVHNDEEDGTLTSADLGAGKHGSAIVCPFNFIEAYQDEWAEHSEIDIPWVPGTDIIPWADVGGDWTPAKWEATGAARRFSRGSNGAITAQLWIFQDDDYLYLATNNRIDGCIQTSDHHELFICTDGSWVTSLDTSVDCLLFRRNIISGNSSSRDPVYPILNTKASDRGEYMMQGSGAPAFPRQWEIPTYDVPSRTHTFASNANTFVEGTDFRMGGPGASTTAPHPSGPGGSYSEFKISKAKLNNWNGFSKIGILINLQCDIQGNGHTMFPTSLGNQMDKLDWFFAGGLYEIGDQFTSSGALTVETIDTRAIMMQHGHSGTPSTGLSVDKYRWRNDDGSESAATWIGAENVPYQIDIIDNLDDTLRLRMNLTESNGIASVDQGYAIECSVNSGAWFRLDRGTPQYLTIDDSTYLTDGENTTEQMAGAGTFVGTAGVDENGVISSRILAGNNDTELEFVIKVIANDFSHGNSCSFRIVADGADAV